MHKDVREAKEARRALVKLYHRRGLAIPDIVRRLAGEGSFFSPVQSYGARRAMVQRDLEAVKQQDAEWFRVSALDAQLALREYLEQQLFLYAKCVESEAWGLALEASKNIARVRGVDPERPAKTEGSIVELLSAAFQSARAKRLEQRQVLAVEAIPQEESALPDLVEIIPRNGKTGS